MLIITNYKHHQSICMFDDIIRYEKDLLATLQAIKELTEEHNIFHLKGMINQIDKLIERSVTTVNGLELLKTKGDVDGKVN